MEFGTVKDGYATLAKQSCQFSIRGCQIRPKLHMYCHLLCLGTKQISYLDVWSCNRSIYMFSRSFPIVLQKICPRLDMEHMLKLNEGQCESILNPSVHATWTDEDFIGRISRISRRTHVLSASWNTLKRSLGHYRRQWAKEFNKSYLKC